MTNLMRRRVQKVQKKRKKLHLKLWGGPLNKEDNQTNIIIVLSISDIYLFYLLTLTSLIF